MDDALALKFIFESVHALACTSKLGSAAAAAARARRGAGAAESARGRILNRDFVRAAPEKIAAAPVPLQRLRPRQLAATARSVLIRRPR